MFCTCNNIQPTQNPYYTITKGMRQVAFEATQETYLIGNTQTEQLQTTIIYIILLLLNPIDFSLL